MIIRITGQSLMTQMQRRSVSATFSSVVKGTCTSMRSGTMCYVMHNRRRCEGRYAILRRANGRNEGAFMRKFALVIALFAALFAAVAVHAEQKNVQLLTNLSDWQLGAVMDNFTASLGVHCDACHVRNEATKQWDFPSDAKGEKKTAREMIRMVIDLNEKSFHGHTVIGCYTCHLGKERPSVMVTLPGAPIPP